MGGAPDTIWADIERAKRGDGDARSLFVQQYQGVVRAYLFARWRSSPLLDQVDDAVQEVFIDFLKGALERADPDRPFRPFLFGVTRNVARRFEERGARHRMAPLPSSTSGDLEADDDPATAVFDRAWAKALVREARALQANQAQDAGAAAARRVELLELRFGEGLPIREIAEHFGEPADRVHRQYAQARREFRRALEQVVRRHHGGNGEGLDAECRRLLDCFAG